MLHKTTAPTPTCIFCGQTCRYIAKPDADAARRGEELWTVQVYCEPCNAKGPEAINENKYAAAAHAHTLWMRALEDNVVTLSQERRVSKPSLLALLKDLWLERLRMHNTCDEFWTGQPEVTRVDQLIEELMPSKDLDTLLARLGDLAQAYDWR